MCPLGFDPGVSVAYRSYGDGALPPFGQKVAQRVLRERAQPAAETERRVVRKRPQLRGQLEQHVLGHILGVALLQPPLPRPGMNLGAVTLDKLRPGLLVGRVVLDAHQQADAGARRRFRLQKYLLSSGAKPTTHFRPSSENRQPLRPAEPGRKKI